MDSFEWNKIFGAVLGTALFIVALNLVVGGYMEPEKSGKPGMEVAVVEDHGTASTPVDEPKPDWGTVLPVADLAAGEKIHARCQQCHDFTKGGPNKIGPNLFGVLGASHARHADFAYSGAMKEMAGKPWGFDEFEAFIKNPKAAIPGTKMSFAGLSKIQDRINLIAYLRTISDTPPVIPTPNPVAPSAPAAPSDGAAEPPAGELQAPAAGTPEGASSTPETPAVPAPTEGSGHQ